MSDTIHQKLNNDKYFSMKEQMLAAITEKKVQIWHSLLRDSIEWHYTAQQIRLNAQLLSVILSQLNIKEALEKGITSFFQDQLNLLLKDCNSLQKNLKAQGRLVKSTRHDL